MLFAKFKYFTMAVASLEVLRHSRRRRICVACISGYLQPISARYQPSR
jgi:hypothetical protein